MRVVLHPWHPPAVDTALRAMPGIDLVVGRNQDEVAATLADGAEVLVTSYWRDDFLTPSLRWIAGTGAGTEQYPFHLLAASGVTLTTAHGVHSACVAEHTFALLLGCTRQIGPAVRNMAGHRWESLAGEEISGRRMLIVGLGLIGEQVARRAVAFGMDVAGIKRDPSQYQGCVPDVRGPAGLAALCEWADVLVVTAPSTPQTRHLIGQRELALLGPGWLVNVARGNLVDHDALLSALVHGGLRGAGLDVTEPEPLPADSALWDLPNVVISAHAAGASPRFGRRWIEQFQQNLAAFSADGEWCNRVDFAKSVV